MDIFRVPKRIDSANAKEVETQLFSLMNTSTGTILCNFKENQYISSAGLRVFLAAMKAMQAKKRKIVLCTLQPFVQEVFDMAGFSGLFQIHETEEQAVQEHG